MSAEAPEETKAEQLLEAESREESGLPLLPRLVARLGGALITLIPIAWAIDLPRTAGFVLYMEQMLLTVLATALLPAFVVVKAAGGRRKGPVPWIDWLLGAAGAVAALYFALDFDEVVAAAPYRPLHLVLMSVALIASVTEAVRRSVGWPLAIIVLFFFAYAAFGSYIPGAMTAQPVASDRLVLYLATDPSALLGSPLQVAVGTVILFILFGQLLEASRGAKFFNDLAVAMMGRYRGGSAKIAIASGALFGTISGSAVANVVVSGILTIPMMRRAGYKPESAAAIEAVSSTGGQIVPPVMGAAAFLMAEFLSVPYATIALAALIPAFLFYVANFVYVDLEAARDGIKGEDPSRTPKVLRTLLAGLHFIVPFVVLVAALFRFNMSIAFAALSASVTIVVLALIVPYGGKRLGWRDAIEAIAKTGLASLDIILVCAAAGFVIGVINITGIGFGLTLQLVLIAEQSILVLLMVTAVLCIILGMGMPTTGVYVLLATIIAPGLIKAGLEPLAAHMFVFYLGMMSMITPPVALASFAAATLAGCSALRAGWASVRVGWTSFVVPFLFVYQPELLMIGKPAAVLLVLLFSITGVTLGTMALIGHGFLGPLPRWQRAVSVLAAVCFLSPLPDLWENALLAGLGVLVAGTSFSVELRRRRKLAPKN